MSEPSRAVAQPRATEVAEPGASTFVWCLWAILSAGAVIFVWRFGPDLPVWDDFDVVDVALGARRLTLGWLWSLHNEHRVPLPRLVLLLLYRISGNDFRVGMIFNVAVLSAVAAAAIVVAGRRAGGARVYDGLFPLVLLNFSHHNNLLWSWQVQLVLSTGIVCGLILLIVARSDWPGPVRAALAGVGLAALCLCGANGVALVPALAVWLLVAAFGLWKSWRPRAALTALAAAPGLALTAMYFMGYHGTANHGTSAGVAAAARTGLQFLALMFGTTAREFWPVSGFAALTLVGSSVLITVRAALIGRAESRPRAIGLLFAFGALGSLVLGLGWGRAGSGEFAGLESRYITLVTPLWLSVFFAWDLHTTAAVRRFVLTSLFAINLVLLWPETQVGIEAGRDKAAQAAQFVRDVRDGVPLYLLTRRHTPYLYPSQDVLARELIMLRDAHIGVFSSIRSNPTFREVTMSGEPADLRMAIWENGTAHVNGVDPELHYILPEARHVAGVRLRYSHSNRSGAPARFRITWTSTAGSAPGSGQRYANWTMPTGKNQVTMIWVADEVKEFWLQPDNQPCEFAIEALTLLLP